ncbi:MAG: hypothetical protein R3F62_17520 [Planctomycetota bacterium]
MGKRIQISLASGQLELDDQAPAEGEDEARNDSTLKIVGEVGQELDALAEQKDLDPELLLRQLWVLNEYLEAFPLRWIRNYGERKGWSSAAAKIKDLRKLGEDGYGEERLPVWETLDYLKQVLPLLFTRFKVRGEVLRLVLTPLGKLKHHEIRYQRDDADDLQRLCEDVSLEIRRSGDLDAQVEAWGTANYPALLQANPKPLALPDTRLPSRGPALGAFLGGLALLGLGAAFLLGKVEVPQAFVLGVVLALLGVVAAAFGLTRLKAHAAASGALPAEFADLASRFRERLYLICSLRLLNKMASRYTRANEGFQGFLRKNGGKQHWKRVKFEGRVLTQTFVPNSDEWHDKETIEHWLSEQVQKTYRLETVILTSPDELDDESWEVILRAYLLESLDDDGSHEAELLDTVADLVFTRRGDDDKAEREAVFRRVYAAWEDRQRRSGRG